MKVISQILDKFGRDDGFAGQSKCVLKEKKRNESRIPDQRKDVCRGLFPFDESKRLSTVDRLLIPTETLTFPCEFKAIVSLMKPQSHIQTSPSVHFNIYK